MLFRKNFIYLQRFVELTQIVRKTWVYDYRTPVPRTSTMCLLAKGYTLTTINLITHQFHQITIHRTMKKLLLLIMVAVVAISTATRAQNPTPITQEPVGVKKEYSMHLEYVYSSWLGISIGEENDVTTIIFADDNETVYIKDILYIGSDNWVYGKLNQNGTKITVPLGQFVSYNNDNNYGIVLGWGSSTVEESGEDAYFNFHLAESVETAIFSIDPTSGVITLDGSVGDINNPEGYQKYEATGLCGYYSDDLSFCTLVWGYKYTPFDLKPAIPANPTADDWYDCGDESGFSKFYFTLPTTDIDGNPLYLKNLSYSIYTDEDQLFTFNGEDYTFDLYADENITEVPYSLYTNAVDFHKNYVYLYRTNENDNPLFEHRIGIQAIYTVETDNGPVVNKSDIVYWPLSVPTNLTVTPGTTTADVAWKDTDNTAWNLRYQVIKSDNQPDEWIYVNNLDATEYTIEGLTPGTDYVVEVQAINGQNISDWTAPTYFTTLFDLVLLDDDSQVAADGKKNSEKLTEVVGKEVQATLSGRTFFKDGNWNTLCLPFSLTEDQIAESPLAGATIKKFYDGNVTGKHVDIVFSDATEIDAGNFYIFKWAETGDDLANPVFNNVEIVKSDEYVVEKKDNDNFLIFGNFDSFPIDPSVDGCYTYFLGSEGHLKYSDKYRVLNTFRIFFRFTADKNDASALELNLIFDDGNTQTGIVELDGVRKNKVNNTYNLQGVKVNDPKQKGIYIQNGRKKVVK